MKRIGFMAFGLDDRGDVVPLHQCAGFTAHAVKQAILAVGEREGFRGTAEERLQQFKWVILPVYTEDLV